MLPFIVVSENPITNFDLDWKVLYKCYKFNKLAQGEKSTIEEWLEGVTFGVRDTIPKEYIRITASDSIGSILLVPTREHMYLKTFFNWKTGLFGLGNKTTKLPYFILEKRLECICLEYLNIACYGSIYDLSYQVSKRYFSPETIMEVENEFIYELNNLK